MFCSQQIVELFHFNNEKQRIFQLKSFQLIPPEYEIISLENRTNVNLFFQFTYFFKFTRNPL
jgi:hypothetical protein